MGEIIYGQRFTREQFWTFHTGIGSAVDAPGHGPFARVASNVLLCWGFDCSSETVGNEFEIEEKSERLDINVITACSEQNTSEV